MERFLGTAVIAILAACWKAMLMGHRGSGYYFGYTTEKRKCVSKVQPQAELEKYFSFRVSSGNK
ncbi:Hypothetical predicted protein [Podarcis lilfordi]|uniref:Secreted protein n=1 Tax=Podarcis lilfordi TaxID=74358 RepID=A0AA35K3Q6_9SAUR|nr:Hypothetical predicted protein [Podarcis lilfordi]